MKSIYSFFHILKCFKISHWFVLTATTILIIFFSLHSNFEVQLKTEYNIVSTQIRPSVEKIQYLEIKKERELNRHTKIEEIIDNNYVEEYSENQIKSEKIILKEEKPYEDPKMIKQRLNARFRRRKIILDRVCSILPSIAEMKKNGTTFEQLLQFHREIHDVHGNWNKKDKRTCNPPRRSKQNAVFQLENVKVLICLPPKCGTTNYQKALAPLIDGYDWRTKTASKVAEDFHAPSVYNLLKRVNPLDFVIENEHYRHYHKTINVRHPFSRLYSAWNDKFRTFLSENGKVDFRESLDNFAHRKEHVELYHNVYYEAIKIFEDDDNPPDFSRNVTFEAFAQYLAANPNQSSYNWHWRSFFWHCSPCQFKYNYITHLEDSTEEGPWLLETWKIDKLTHLPKQYQKSPMKKHDPEYYWRNVPKETIKELYKANFEDFIMFDYTADSVISFVDAGLTGTRPSDSLNQETSKTAMKEHREEQCLKHDFAMCNWYTDEDKQRILGKFSPVPEAKDNY